MQLHRKICQDLGDRAQRMEDLKANIATLTRKMGAMMSQAIELEALYTKIAAAHQTAQFSGWQQKEREKLNARKAAIRAEYEGKRQQQCAQLEDIRHEATQRQRQRYERDFQRQLQAFRHDTPLNPGASSAAADAAREGIQTLTLRQATQDQEALEDFLGSDDDGDSTAPSRTGGRPPWQEARGLPRNRPEILDEEDWSE
ncbi:hypothetical protein IWQ60_001096 [Tieghemiomyces parasiticus]|uniref:Uncharacterized protein n=1 Tax=Tieghemiomyces parasiticus TaxID=78921 RepID=A0A9W8AFB5_9FUNG|nr:hypothetical protein IWQ60_001096 [Tieghemiomyces parasiticus]